jgi:hypothetical protein
VIQLQPGVVLNENGKTLQGPVNAPDQNRMTLNQYQVYAKSPEDGRLPRYDS